jgi:hypothetical protein
MFKKTLFIGVNKNVTAKVELCGFEPTQSEIDCCATCFVGTTGYRSKEVIEFIKKVVGEFQYSIEACSTPSVITVKQN